LLRLSGDGRPVSNFLPLGDGSFLKVGGSHTKREVAKFSARDAERLDDYQRRLAAVANVLRAGVLETPPNVVEGSPFAVIAELLKADTIANRIRALGLDLQRDFLDLFVASAGDFLIACSRAPRSRPPSACGNGLSYDLLDFGRKTTILSAS
jgi:phytoene dehydrogenase-like protein